MRLSARRRESHPLHQPGGQEGLDDSPAQRDQPGPRQKDLQGPPGAPASSELRWRIGCRRCRGPGSRGNGDVGPAASSMWAVPGRKPYASPAISASGRLGVRVRPPSRFASGSPGSSSRLCSKPILTHPYPSEVGDRRSWAIPEPVDEPKPLRIDRFRTIRVVLAGEVKAYRSNPPPPRSGPLGRGGRGTGMTMLGPRSRSRICSRSLIVSRTAHARRSANTRSIR